MTDEREIYVAALKLDNEMELDGFLSRVCHGRPKLRSRVEQLLRARTQNEGNLLVQITGGSEQTPPYTSNHETRGYAGVEPDACDSIPLPELDRFQIVREIGRGGMGTVYLARQIEPVHRDVAIKVINPGMDSREVLSRFEAERQTLALMDHPNIARVFDGGTTVQGLPFFAMELVRGLPITDYCHKQGLGLKERIKLFVDVCHAVQHAHQKGIIHRDLKPNNLLVSRDKDRAIVKVIDFGVAKALARDDVDQTALTQHPSFIGTPLYMSPEQARPADLGVDTRSDVYSLGVVLYELLTGTTPFRRETLSRIGLDAFRELITDEEAERPSSRLTGSKSSGDRSDRTVWDYRPADLRHELDWVVLKTLEKDRDRRYESAKAIADDLGRYLHGEAVAACPPTVSYRLRKWCSQNRFAVAMASLALLTLLFVTATSVWQVRQVTQAWSESQRREHQAMDLLSANQLQSAVRALRESNFRSIPDLLHTRDASMRFERESQGPQFFRQLFLDLASPSYDAESVLPGETEDLAWDESAGHAWVLDSEGQLFQFHCIDDSTADPSSSLKQVADVGRPADSIAVSPDGQSLAIGMRDGQVSLWDLQPKPVQRTTVEVGDGGVETVVWSDDGRYLAAGTRYDGFWVGRADGEKLFRVENNHRHESLVFLPGGDELIVPTRQGFDYYSVPAGKRLRSIPQQHEANPRELVLAGPNKSWLLTCDRFLQRSFVYDAATGTEIGDFALGAAYPQSLAVWHDGRWVTAVYPNGLLEIISLSQFRSGKVTGDSVAQFNISDDGDELSNDAVLRVCVVPGRDRFVTASPGGRLRDWSANRVIPTQRLQPPSKLDAAYTTAPDVLTMFFAQRLASGKSSGGRSVPRGISHKSNQRIGEFVGMPVTCYSKQISKQGWIACAGPNHVTIYDVGQGRVVRRLTPGLDIARVVEISEMGDAVAVNGGVDGGVMAWATQNQWESASTVFDKQIHVDGVMCFDRRADETVFFYDESSRRVVEIRISDGHSRVLMDKKSHRFMSSAFSPSEQLLAIGTRDALRIIDLEDRGRGFTVEQMSSVRSVAFLPGSQVLLTGHDNATVEGWHLSTKQSLGTVIEGKPGMGIPVGISAFPDCHRLLVNYLGDEGILPLVVGTDKKRVLKPGGSR